MKNIFIILLYFFISHHFEVQCFAADVYMSTTGTKTSGKSTAGDWSNANCYSNLAASFAAMSASDTLTINDGVYTGSTNAIHQTQRPPSGSAGNFTIVKARNIPGQDGVAENQPLKVHFTASNSFNDNAGAGGAHVAYVKFMGIRWNGVSTGMYWDHIYFKQVASQGVLDGNTAAFTILGQYNLLEDCVAYGKGRYKFLFYDLTRELQTRGDGNNVCRRCVARHDWAKKEDGSGDPIATFVSYYNRGTVFLNAIDVDSNTPAYWMNSPGEFNGAFLQAVDSGAHKMEVHGSLVINAAHSLGFGASPATGADSGNKFTDVVTVNTAGGLNLRGGGIVNRIGMYNVNSSQFLYRSSTQMGQILSRNMGVLSWDNNVSVSSSIFRNTVGAPLTSASTGSYIDAYLVGSGGNTLTNSLTTDPYLHGVKYPVRIEPTAPNELLTQGESSTQIGPKIVNKLGKDGTFKGDPDWNTEQEALWPWPLESWIQAEMRTSDYASFCAPFVGTAQACPASYTTDSYRGFCALSQTLTNYIWGSMGNIVPPFNLKATPATNSATNTTINLAWILNTANPSVTGYKVYVGTSSGNYNLPGYEGGKKVGKVATTTITGLNPTTLYYISVTAEDSNSSKESGYSYELVTTPLDTTPPTKQVTSASVSSLSPGSSSSGGGGGGCFIATAAYGSYLHPQVQVLRNFRDTYLLTNSTGRAFVALYYQVSPPIADYIAGNDTLRFCVRLLLTPIVLMVAYPEASIVVVLCIFTCMLVRRRLSKSAPACNVSAC